MRPHLEYTIQVNYPYPKNYIHYLEKNQNVATMWVKCLKGLTCDERINALKLQSLNVTTQALQRAMTKTSISEIDL